MKKKTFCLITLIYAYFVSIVAVIKLNIGIMSLNLPILGMISEIYMLAVGILMFIGHNKFNKSDKNGRILLIVSGILTLPLGLIIAYYAYNEKKLEK